MMISPERFEEHWERESYPELIRERDRLIDFLRDFEKKEMAGDRSDPAWRMHPSPEVQYQVYFDYLAVLCGVMHRKYNSEYIWGERSLKDDVIDCD